MDERFPCLYLPPPVPVETRWIVPFRIEIKYFYKDVIRKYVDLFHLAYTYYITSRQSVVIMGCRTTKDIRRLCSVRFFRVWRLFCVWRLFFSITAGKPSERRRAIGIDISGWVRKWRGEGGTGVVWLGVMSELFGVYNSYQI
jgi:hypothetical protein